MFYFFKNPKIPKSQNPKIHFFHKFPKSKKFFPYSE